MPAPRLRRLNDRVEAMLARLERRIDAARHLALYARLGDRLASDGAPPSTPLAAEMSACAAALPAAADRPAPTAARYAPLAFAPGVETPPAAHALEEPVVFRRIELGGLPTVGSRHAEPEAGAAERRLLAAAVAADPASPVAVRLAYGCRALLDAEEARAFRDAVAAPSLFQKGAFSYGLSFALRTAVALDRRLGAEVMRTHVLDIGERLVRSLEVKRRFAWRADTLPGDAQPLLEQLRITVALLEAAEALADPRFLNTALKTLDWSFAQVNGLARKPLGAREWRVALHYRGALLLQESQLARLAL